MRVKAEKENEILSKIQIIVTTCKAAQSRGLKDITFKKIIIDEATQASEIEVLSTMMDADQVVLIGDHK
jgi:superfamily I DNA and/or RNA helicase